MIPRPALPAHLHVVAARPASDPGDVELARGLREQRPGALDRAFARYGQMVFGTIARTLGNDEDARDLTQEVFLRLHQRAQTLEDLTALRSFVYSIVVRVLRGDLRKRWVRRIMHLTDGRAMPEVPGRDQGDPEARAAVLRLYEVLDTLQPMHRTLYVLRHIEALTLEETARAAGVSLATAKRHLQVASSRVEKRIADDPLLNEYLTARRPEGSA